MPMLRRTPLLHHPENQHSIQARTFIIAIGSKRSTRRNYQILIDLIQIGFFAESEHNNNVTIKAPPYRNASTRTIDINPKSHYHTLNASALQASTRQPSRPKTKDGPIKSLNNNTAHTNPAYDNYDQPQIDNGPNKKPNKQFRPINNTARYCP